MNWTFPIYEIGQAIRWDLLEARFDWFADMRGVPQDAIWHAEGDVFTHTKMVVEALVSLPEFQPLSDEQKHILFAAAMLHDVEKRSTTSTEVINGKERIVSPRHAKKGEFTARTFLYKELKTPFAIREQIAKLVRLHGLPLWALHKSSPEKVVIEASLSVDTTMLAMLAKADVLGRICQDAEDMLLRIDLFQALCEEQNCWGKSKAFKSDYGRYLYLSRTGFSPDYEPYEDCKFEVYMMSALPGSGKDTYIQKNLDLPILSLDDIRRAHKIAPTDKKKNGRVIQMGMEQAKVWMRQQQSFVFNATNITSDMRSKWIGLFTEYGGRVKIVYLEVPYRQLLQQNRQREHQVPASVIEQLIGKLEIPGCKEAHEVLMPNLEKALF